MDREREPAAPADQWSAIALDWSKLWGPSSAAIRSLIIEAIPVRAGMRVLDVGCGAGELLADLTRAGAAASGLDPACEMVRLAAERAPDADVRCGEAEQIPWPNDAFDLVTAVNSLHYAQDSLHALAEIMRVLRPGQYVAIANWGEGSRSDLGVLERAIAAAEGEEPGPDGELQLAGGLEQLLREAGFSIIVAGLTEAPWQVPDESTLVEALLIGADAAAVQRFAPIVTDAARPFRTSAGAYRLVNAFRYAIATAPV